MTSFFSAEGGPIWIKFRTLVQNDVSSAVMCGNGNQMYNSNMADVWANSMACHPRATCHIEVCCHMANSMSDPRASCHSHCRVLPPDEFNGMSFQSHVLYCRVLPLDALTVMIQSHMPHCRVQSPGEINVMIVPHCRV